MKRSWLTGMVTGLVVCGALLAFGRGLGAQGKAAPTGRVAYVNVIKALNEFQGQKDLVEEIAKAQDKLAAENKARRDKLDTSQAELERLDPQDPTMVQRMREHLAQQVDYKNWGEMAQLNLAREFGIWSVRFYKDLLKVTEEIAKREGYDLVLYKGEFESISMDPEQIKEQIRSLHVLYANPTTELTQLVLDKLNADYRAKPKAPMIPAP
jgi:Skp family chaperone for outer membrane proteins